MCNNLRRLATLCIFIGLVSTAPISAMGQSIITNGDFEAGPFDSGWTGNSGGGAELHDGIAPGSTQAAKVVSLDWLAQNKGQLGTFAGPDWEMDLYFAGNSGGGSRWFNVILPPNDAINGISMINQRVDNAGNLQVFDDGWQTIASGFSESVDANGDGDFSDVGDTLNVYHYNVRGFGFGTPTPSYDISLSNANSDTLVQRGRVLDFFQGSALQVAQDPLRPGIPGLTLTRGFTGTSTGFTVFDNVVLQSTGVSFDGNQWAGPSGGNWNSGGNWIGSVPNSAGAEARLGANINSPSTVNLNTPITVGSIEIAGLNAYTISGANALTLNGTGIIEVPTITSGTEIASVVAGSSGLTKEGAGTLVLSGNNTFSGGVTLKRGRLSVSNNTALGNSSNSLSFEGGGLQVTGTTFASTTRTMTLGGDGAQFFDVVEPSHTFTVSQAVGGAGGFVKEGLGTLQLSAANTFTGVTKVTDGSLAISNSNALGGGGNGGSTDIAGGETTGRLSLSNAGTVSEIFNLAGRETSQAPHIVNQSGNNTLSGTINTTSDGFVRIDSNSGSLNVSGTFTNDDASATKSRTSTLVLGGSGSGEFSGVFSNGLLDVTGLTKTGTGTWSITNGSGNSSEQPNGDLLIEQGTLEVQDTLANNQGELASSNITVLAGGTFDVDAFSNYSLQPNQSLSGDGTVRATTLTFFGDNRVSPGDNGAGTLTIDGSVSASDSFATADGGFKFELSNATTVGAGVNDLVDVSGTLNISNDIDVTILPLGTNGLASGTYQLFSAGSITGSASDVKLDNTTRYNMTVTKTATQVNVNVSGSAANITWTGASDSVWDINNSQNWNNSGADVFFNADTITFDNTAANKTVDLVDAVRPSAVSINNSTGNDYTISGVGLIDGATGISKQGTGRATISTANTFDGAVTVSGGTLHAASNGALGSTVGGTTVASGATLDVGGADLLEENISVQGAGVGGQGAITSSAVGNVAARNISHLTLTGNTTFGAVGTKDAWEVRGLDNDTPPVFTGGGHTLTKEGAGIVSISNAGDTDLGNITINNGSLVFQTNSTLGRAGTVTVNAGGELGLFSNSSAEPVPTPSKTIVLNGGTLSNAVGENGSVIDQNITAPINLVASSTLTARNTGRLSISTPLTGASAGITKEGNGTVVLNSANTYGGNTVINEGTLRLGAGSIANSPMIEVRSAGNFDVSGQAAYNLASGRTLKGSGAVSGNVTAASGSTIDPTADGPTKTISLLPVQSLRMRYDPDGANNDIPDLAPELFVGPLREDDVSRSLLEFDLSSISSNVQSVELVLQRRNINPTATDQAVTIEAHRLNKSFVIGETTAFFASAGDPWAGPGGNGDFGPLLSSVSANASEFGAAGNDDAQLAFANTPQFLADVQNAVNTAGSLNVLLKVDDINEADDGDNHFFRFDGFQQNGEGEQGPTLNVTVPVFGGILTVDGDYTQNSGSTLAIDLGGADIPGFDFDQLNIEGNAAINGGILDVDLVGGFTPSLGDMFDILDFASAGGAGFDGFNLPSLTGGLSWDTSDLLTTGILGVVTGGAGDFDGDNDVDGADFLLWQRGGSPNGIGSGDLGLWQANYGNTGALASASTVPEPTAAIMLMLGLGIMASRRHVVLT